MIDRARAEQAFRDAVRACDPEVRVRRALSHLGLPGERRLGVAVGKAAIAMARGIGPVVHGIAVTVPGADRSLPAGWELLHAGHPEPDERSVAAGQAVARLVAAATPDQLVVAAISGGASALIEQPRISLPELRSLIAMLMATGAPIRELNCVRSALSELKAGGLAIDCAAPILTLVASDVIGDPMDVIGSGPTIGPWLVTPGARVDSGFVAEANRRVALEILCRHGIAAPAVMERAIGARHVTRVDRAQLVLGIGDFAEQLSRALGARLRAPHARTVSDVADELAAEQVGELVVGWGEPTLRVPPDHGEGGRAQQLALELARRLRGTDRGALVAGSDGIDGPAPRDRPAPAGAFIDGTTWDAIAARGIDPAAALAHCDAGTALHVVGALFVPGPTGVNHADIAIVG